MENSNASFIQETLARVRRLQSRTEREATCLHYVEGFLAFLQMIDARIPIDTIVYSEVLAQNPVVQKHVRLCRRAGVPVARVTPEQFRAVSGTERASGIGVIAHQHWTPIERVDPRRGLCWVAVSRLRSAGNLGTLLRTAEAVAAGGLIFLGNDSDPFDPNVVRASIGTLFSLPVVETTTADALAWLKARKFKIVAATPHTDKLFWTIDMTGNTAIVVGTEQYGLSAKWLDEAELKVSIPMGGQADSLNVASATTILLYEAVRQRQKNKG